MIDNRGQALQVGAVLLLGILVVLIAVWQATVIPEQNEQVEFEHNQQVQSEMVDLRGELLSAADGSTPSSSPIQLGTDFPSRLLFVNPSSATGNLQTEEVGDGTITIDNARAVDDSVSHFWDGSKRTYESDSLRYSPDYRLFNGAPETVFDNSVVYNTFENEDTTLAVSQQSLINSDRITLLALEGDYFETGVGSESPDIEPVSTGSRTIDIEPDGGENITIEIPTRLNESEWEELVEGEDNIESVEAVAGEDAVRLVLKDDTYELNMAKLGIGPAAESTDPAYITEVEGENKTAFVDEPHTITVEVRDEFNVPQSGVELNVYEDGDPKPSVTTGPDGQASYEFTPTPADSSGEPVEIEFEAVDYADVENITVDVDVSERDTGNATDFDNPGGLPGLNPAPGLGTIYIEEIQNPKGGGGGTSIDVTFNNSADQYMTLHAQRFSYIESMVGRGQGAGDSVSYTYPIDDGDTTDFIIPGPFKIAEDESNFNAPQIAPDDTKTINLEFSDAKSGDAVMMHIAWEDPEGNLIIESYFYTLP